jgi:hypothetical protein
MFVKYTVMQSQIQLGFIVMAPAWGKMADSIANGGWKNRIVGEHMCISNLFLNSF